MVKTKWIYTAITRTTNLNNIQFYMGSEYSLDNNEIYAIKYKIKNDIENHKIADKNANRDTSDYVDVEMALNILDNTSRCALCMKDICEDFSIDR